MTIFRTVHTAKNVRLGLMILNLNLTKKSLRRLKKMDPRRDTRVSATRFSELSDAYFRLAIGKN